VNVRFDASAAQKCHSGSGPLRSFNPSLRWTGLGRSGGAGCGAAGEGDLFRRRGAPATPARASPSEGKGAAEAPRVTRVPPAPCRPGAGGTWGDESTRTREKAGALIWVNALSAAARHYRDPEAGGPMARLLLGLLPKLGGSSGAAFLVGAPCRDAKATSRAEPHSCHAATALGSARLHIWPCRRVRPPQMRAIRNIAARPGLRRVSCARTPPGRCVPANRMTQHIAAP
jgi:hypothetical protein